MTPHFATSAAPTAQHCLSASESWSEAVTSLSGSQDNEIAPEGSRFHAARTCGASFSLAIGASARRQQNVTHARVTGSTGTHSASAA